MFDEGSAAIELSQSKRQERCVDLVVVIKKKLTFVATNV